ncbi:MAG: flippase-like domain-containing protein [Chloroflexi bacterium]|nr:flippase-like domain-containing protein [Chloroflexota bacterium]
MKAEPQPSARAETGALAPAFAVASDRATSAGRPTDGPSASPRRLARPETVLSFVIPLGLLYVIAARGFNLSLAEVWDRLRTANNGLLLLAVGVFYTSFVPRTHRWRTLLENAGLDRAAYPRIPRFGRLYEMVVLSTFVNTVTVARLGDAYRGHLLTKAAGVSFTATLGTILAERLVDVAVIALTLTLAALVAFGGQLPEVAADSLLGGAALGVLGLMVLVSLRRLAPLVQRCLPVRWRHHYASFEQGAVGSIGRVPLLVALSAAGWLVESATLYLSAIAVGAGISPAGAVVAALVASLAGILPFTPGGLGVTEASIVLILAPLGVDPTSASAVAVLNRVINYWSLALVGVGLYLTGRGR